MKDLWIWQPRGENGKFTTYPVEAAIRTARKAITDGFSLSDACDFAATKHKLTPAQADQVYERCSTTP